MLTVSKRAEERLKQALKEYTRDIRKGIRLILNPFEQPPFDFILDEAGSGDQVVKSEEGSQMLIIGAGLASALGDMVIDYLDTPIGPGFAFLPNQPVN